jgi:hypothetical protein
MSLCYEITDLSGIPTDVMAIGAPSPGTSALPSVMIKNTGTETADVLDFAVFCADGAETGAVRDGSEVIAEGMLQARESGAPGWWPVLGGAGWNPLVIGTPPSPGNTITIELQFVVPGDATPGGVRFSPRAIFWRNPT